jgi:hypothetical protein
MKISFKKPFMSYTPNKSETFVIYVSEGVTNLIITSGLPREAYPLLLNLAFFYSPIVWLSNEQDSDQSDYVIAQENNSLDLKWLLGAMSHFEDGWKLTENVLYSPIPSTVPSDSQCSA